LWWPVVTVARAMRGNLVADHLPQWQHHQYGLLTYRESATACARCRSSTWPPCTSSATPPHPAADQLTRRLSSWLSSAALRPGPPLTRLAPA
jgi:hypothetical protein